MGADSPIGPPHDPHGIYIGALRPGRVCYDHRGEEIIIISQGMASTLVHRRRIDKEGEYEDIPISPNTVVYTSRKEVPV